MLGLVDSFSDKWLAFLWEQTVAHYWLTCFSIDLFLYSLLADLFLTCLPVYLTYTINMFSYQQIKLQTIS